MSNGIRLRPVFLRARTKRRAASGGTLVPLQEIVAGAHPDYPSALKKMTGLKPKVFKPNAKAHETYKELYVLYRQLHDAFGTKEWSGNLYDVMKELIEIRSCLRQ